MPDVIREATDSAATAGNPAPANATTQANRAQSAPPSSVPSADDAHLGSQFGAKLAWFFLPPAEREAHYWRERRKRKRHGR